MTTTSYLHQLDAAVEYALTAASATAVPPTSISPGLAYEINHIIHTVKRAQRNQRGLKWLQFNILTHPPLDTIPWDTRTYDYAVRAQDGSNLKAEAILRQQFPPVNLSLSNPAVIQDSSAHIVAYYLPDLLLPSRQVCW